MKRQARNAKPPGTGWRRLYCATCHAKVGWHRPHLIQVVYSAIACDRCRLGAK